MILPYAHSEEEAIAIIDKLDGIVFTGGTDVPPGWYGEEILNDTVITVKKLKNSTLVISVRSLDLRTPQLVIPYATKRTK